jgi:HEAT repeat protein
MGLFDLFKGKNKADTKEAASAVDKNVARLARVAGDKHAQNYDRIEAIEALARSPSTESAAALLKRFTFHIDPSITDQEEKEAAHRGVLAAGEAAIEPIRTFCTRAESLAWPLKILKELLPEDRYVPELIRLLERFDTEYTRNTEPKQQLLSELEQYKNPDIRRAVETYLEDVNEAVRFGAVATLYAQEDPAIVTALVKTLVGEESIRVKNRIAEGMIPRGWSIPEELRDGAKKSLPTAFAVGADGTVKRR